MLIKIIRTIFGLPIVLIGWALTLLGCTILELVLGFISLLASKNLNNTGLYLYVLTVPYTYLKSVWVN
jgi:hypothetical protein